MQEPRAIQTQQVAEHGAARELRVSGTGQLLGLFCGLLDH